MNTWLTNWQRDNDRPAALADLIEGDPKPSDQHSVAELKELGFIGLYRLAPII